jgi:hypothetical protein
MKKLKEVPMKSIIVSIAFVLSACGTKELAEALKEANASSDSSASEQTTSTSAIAVATVTPSPTATPKSERQRVEEYQKIAEGMAESEILAILGEPSERKQSVICSSGSCTTFIWFFYKYAGGHTTSVRFKLGIADYVSSW